MELQPQTLTGFTKIPRLLNILRPHVFINGMKWVRGRRKNGLIFFTRTVVVARERKLQSLQLNQFTIQ